MNSIDKEKLGKSAPDLLNAHFISDLYTPASPVYYLAVWAATGSLDDLRRAASLIVAALGGPASACLAAGDAMAYGRNKHGQCTWRVAGTEQAKVHTHYASALRHLLEAEADSAAVETGSRLPVLVHALAQISIIYDLVLNPPYNVDGDRDWEIK